MDTGIRRFMLRLVVGLLTFAVGVVAAMALGGFRPFRDFVSSPNYSYRRGHCPKMAPEPPTGYYEYDEHGCRKGAHYRTAELPPPPPPPQIVDAPLPPEQPRPTR